MCFTIGSFYFDDDAASLPSVPGCSGGDIALTCPHCNSHKWSAVEAANPLTGASNRLFHPRVDDWTSHFEWSANTDGELVGKTPAGRATIAALQINDSSMIRLRILLAELGLFAELPRLNRPQPAKD